MNLIGIAGKAESGKDTAAGFITAVYPRHYYRRAFADALKRDAVATWLRAGDVDSWPQDAVLKLADEMKLTSPEFRTFLQDFGQARRQGDPTYWIDRLFRDHANTPGDRHMGLVIPDVRYKNEAAEVLNNGGLILRLERPGHENRLTPEQRAHSSETELDDWPESENYRIVENTGDPVALLREVLRHVNRFNGWRA